MRIGIGISEDLPIPEQQGLAREVEQAGFASLWTNEASGRDALLLCLAWALATDELEVGVGVVPLWTRSAPQLAMASATIDEASGGRFLLGLGVSHPATMGPWHDVDYRRPLTAARDTLAILDALRSGARVEHEGEVRSAERFQLAITPIPPRGRTYLAAMGPRMRELAGHAADGILLNWSSPDEIARAGEDARSAADAPFEVATYLRVAVSEDRDAARAALARQVGAYCALPAYAEHFTRQGFGDMVDAVKAAYREGGADAVPGAIDDDVLLELGWYGTPDDDPTEVLDRYRGAGLDHLVARVVVVGDDAARSVRDVLGALPGER